MAASQDYCFAEDIFNKRTEVGDGHIDQWAPDIEDVDAAFSFDIHNRQAQGILNRTVKAAKKMSATARRELADALESTNSGEAILEFIDKYRLQLARILTTTQLASLLEGAQEVANKVPPLGTVPIEGLPIIEQERIASIPPIRPFTLTPPESGTPEEVHFPVIDEAVKNLAQRNVLTRDQYDSLEAAARAKAFTVANVAAEETLTKIRDSLARNVEQGADYATWRKKVLADVDEGTFLSEGHQETIFRTNVQTAFSDGQAAVLSHPLVRSGFPYSTYDAIHDDRVRDNHLALEKHGINGSNIYRNDDPVFQLFRPPWDYNDRCGWTPLTVQQAAERGIAEAKEWLETGIEPAQKAFVSMPPFSPPPGFQRAVSSAPLSIQLSMQSAKAFGWVTVGGRAEGEEKHKDGTPVFIGKGGVVTKGPQSLKGKDLDDSGEKQGKPSEPQTKLPDISEVRRPLTKAPATLEAYGKKLAAGLSKDQKVALSNYTTEQNARSSELSYLQLNKAIRSCPDGSCLSEKQKQAFDQLNEIASAPLPHPALMFRGVDFVMNGEKYNAFMDSMRESMESGKEVQFHGVSSFSLDPEIAGGHANGNIVMEVIAKTGAYLDPLSDVPGEHEVIQKHGVRYKVKAIQKRRGYEGVGQNVTVIQMEEV